MQSIDVHSVQVRTRSAMHGSIGPCLPHELLCPAQGFTVFPMGDVSRQWTSGCHCTPLSRCDHGVATSRRSGVEYGTCHCGFTTFQWMEYPLICSTFGFILSADFCFHSIHTFIHSLPLPNSFDSRLGSASNACPSQKFMK